MRSLLLALSCVACTATPTETVVARKRQALSCVTPVPCQMIADTSTIWLNGQKYLEIVEHCE